MDAIDKQILSILAQDSNATSTEISERVNLSVPAVNKRIQKLRGDGVIRSFTILTDTGKVGKAVTAFVFVVFRYGDDAACELMKYVENDRDVLECYAVTGEYDYVIKLCAESVEALEKKLLCIKRQKGVVRSYTVISLAEHKFKPTALPSE